MTSSFLALQGRVRSVRSWSHGACANNVYVQHVQGKDWSNGQNTRPTANVLAEPPPLTSEATPPLEPP